MTDEAANDDQVEATDTPAPDAPVADRPKVDVVEGDAVELPDDLPGLSELAIPDDPYRAMALADELQIVDEIQGRALEEMVYAFPMDGGTVTGLSWKGVREVVRTLNARGFTRIHIAKDAPPVFKDTTDEHGDPAYECMVYAADDRTGGGVWGLAIQPKLMTLRKKDAQGNRLKKPDPFARTKALSKAQRNAYEALIPEELVAAVKAQFHREGRVKRLPGAVQDAPSNRPPPLTDDRAKEQIERCRLIWDGIKSLNRQLLPPGKFNLLVRNAEHDHGRLDDLIAHLEDLREKERTIDILRDVLASHVEAKDRFDRMMKAVDAAGGQDARIAQLRKFVEDERIEASAEAALEGKTEDG